jgi:hypothetical protein
MSATGLEVFDKTLQTTNLWLDDISKEIGPDRQVAWHVLGAVLHALRDRLPIDWPRTSARSFRFWCAAPITINGGPANSN